MCCMYTDPTLNVVTETGPARTNYKTTNLYNSGVYRRSGSVGHTTA